LPEFLKLSTSSYAAGEGLPLSELPFSLGQRSPGCVVQGPARARWDPDHWGSGFDGEVAWNDDSHMNRKLHN